MLIPAGLISEAQVRNSRFFVQTEFAQRPQPRVTTTISINGAVVEKIENVWDRLPQTEEDKEEIEKFLKRQHRQVLEKIKDKKEKLAGLVPEKGKTILPEDDVILKIREEFSKTEGVLGWVFIFNDEPMISHAISEKEQRQAEDLVRSIKDLSILLTPVAELRKFGGGILETRKNRAVFIPLKRHFLAVQLDLKVDFKKLVVRIKAIEKAITQPAYHSQKPYA
jgi:hypothetical protein